ncbi:MAG: AAA family ATPase [Chloroflexi bacterium]|nr:AAA family ATPase [Chloroflexota bacterium]
MNQVAHHKTTTIAVAGKGGTGKTTIAALLIQLLSRQGTVLAIDADPSSNLHMCLGLPLEGTIGGVREDAAKKVRSGEFQAGMSKASYLELGIREVLVESEHVDLLAMGRPEGPGCYCAANNVLRAVIDQMETNYDYVVIDNEAGLEHLSRQTTRDVDVLLIVSDASVRGLVTAARIKNLVAELKSDVRRMGLVINRVPGKIPPAIERQAAETGLEVLAVLPVDNELAGVEEKGEPLTKLSDRSSLREGVADLAIKLGLVAPRPDGM